MTTRSLKSQFLLDPDVIFLNHGSFGACPRPVFENYQWWQRELERQPVEFLGRQFTALLAEARARLAAYLGAQADELVYFTNPTTALNMVARSLSLEPGDEILTTDHEYGAMDRTWQFICKKTGANYVRHPIPLPVTSHGEFVEHFWGGVTERTRAIFLSHITSSTALIFPVQELCRRARQSGLLTVIDGAHAPGQIRLNLSDLGADVYAGTCHKWVNSPKGSAFLYARPEVQHWLEPLVVSWGWEDETFEPDPTLGDTQFIRYHQWQGTRDVAAFLATPTALQFQADHDWEAVRAQCHVLASETRQRVNELTGLEAICPDSPDWFAQMVTVRLPQVDVKLLKTQLYNQYRIEAPIFEWNGQSFMRVSFQAYNSRQDADALVAALSSLLRG